MIDKKNNMTLHYYLRDHLGSVRVVMDAEGGEELGQGSEPVCTVFFLMEIA